MLKKYFNESDLQLFTLSDLVGRTVEVRQFKDVDNAECQITIAHDTGTGDIFVLNVAYSDTVVAAGGKE